MLGVPSTHIPAFTTLTEVINRGADKCWVVRDSVRSAVMAEILSAQKPTGHSPAWGGPGKTARGCSQAWGTFQQMEQKRHSSGREMAPWRNDRLLTCPECQV